VDDGGQREPGDEADGVGGAIVDHRLAGAVVEIVEVLDAGDREHLAGRLDLLDADLAEARMLDQAVLQHIGVDTELLVARDLGVDAVQLPEGDLFQLQPAQAHQHALAQIFGAANRHEDVRSVPRQTALVATTTLS
jgi:hypothetical protein